MKKMYQCFSYVSITIFCLLSCSKVAKQENIQSPSGDIKITFLLSDVGAPLYMVSYKNKPVVDTSRFGRFSFTNQAAIDTGLKVTNLNVKKESSSWGMPWGEQRTVHDEYQEMQVRLQEKHSPHRSMLLYLRAYDDGIGFRYELLEQDGVDSVFITDEHTQFQLTGNHNCWWIPGDWDIYEHLYNHTDFSHINAIEKRGHPNLAQTHIPSNAVNTPITMRTKDGLHLSFHEANLTNYAGMTLKVDTTTLQMESELVGSLIKDYKVKRKLPFKTPWRTIQIAPTAVGLINSKLILNLNEPNKLGNMDWFKPMKYMGIWWEMHMGVSTWDMEATQDMSTFTTQKASSKKHGATTENAKRYIDFAAKHDIKGLLIEGWNTGWNNWIGFEDREGVFDFVTPYADYDLEEVVQYANNKGIDIIMHHETSAAPRTYEKQMDTAFSLMQRLGIHAVKTGYVGKIIPKGEFHHGQWMVNHYRKVLLKAAKKRIAINAHEPIKPTGIRRTYPNAISREGLRGQEFNAWSIEKGNPIDHLSVIAFTRMLAGPIDFTPGAFNMKLNPTKENQINTTIAHQLALYVVIYSPIQMACDLPEVYEKYPAAFQFIDDVGVDWEQSIAIDGEVGDFVTIARQDRKTMNWFVGSITDEQARDISIDFSFLEKGKQYEAVVYKDGKNAHWNNNPTSIDIGKMTIQAEDKHTFKLAEGGGLAISLKQIK